LGAFYFGKIGKKEEAEKKAMERCEEIGLKGLKIIVASK
jgi:hypothetical protein